MTTRHAQRLAGEISANAHGRAVHAIGPVLAVCDRDRREAVYRLLSLEFQAFEDSLLNLLSRGPHQRRSAAVPKATRSEPSPGA